MKKQKSIDSLLNSLEHHKDAVVIDQKGNSTKYWHGIIVYAGSDPDARGSGRPD